MVKPIVLTVVFILFFTNLLAFEVKLDNFFIDEPLSTSPEPQNKPPIATQVIPANVPLNLGGDLFRATKDILKVVYL